METKNEVQYIEKLLNEREEIHNTIENEMKYYSDISSYELKDVMIAFAYFIKDYEIVEHEQNIIHLTNYIYINLIEYMFNNPEIFVEFEFLLGTLKNKYSKTEKDTQERLILKKSLNKIKEVYNIYKESKPKKEEEDPYFKILEYWLQDESNYTYIEELVKRNRKIVNTKHENKHIVIYILDLYIDNFKKMYTKTGDYINTNYLKNVYYLFTKSYLVRLTKEEKDEIDAKVNELKDFIKQNTKSRKKFNRVKKHAIDEAKTFGTHNYYKKYIDYDYMEFSDDLLNYESTCLKKYTANNKENLEEKETNIFCGQMYDIKKEEDGYVLSLHVVNYGPFIPKNSLLDKYFQKCELTNEDVDDFFKKTLLVKENKAYPVITYEMKFFPSGKINRINIKQNRVIPTNRDNYFSDKEDTKLLKELYKKSTVKNGGRYSENVCIACINHFEDLLQNEYVKYLKENKLPYIYYGYSIPSEDMIEKNKNDLAETLNGLDKINSYEILNIISSRIDKPHYSCLPIDNGKYDMHLLDPLCFLGIENERMINNLIFDERKLKDKNKIHHLKLIFLGNYIKTVEDLNKNINYVDVQNIKMSKGKIRNRIRL